MHPEIENMTKKLVEKIVGFSGEHTRDYLTTNITGLLEAQERILLQTTKPNSKEIDDAETRQIAMNWWNTFNNEEKQSITNEFMYGRTFNTLTGREIELIYKNRTSEALPQNTKYRIGKKQSRAILEVATGHEYLVFPEHRKEHVKMFCDFLNGETHENLCAVKIKLEKAINFIKSRVSHKDLCELRYEAGGNCDCGLTDILKQLE